MMTEYVKTFLEERARPPIEKRGDYKSNGILYCGECGEPKQAWVDWLPDKDGNVEKKLVPVMCKCARDKERREKEEREYQRFAEALRYFNVTITGNELSICTGYFRDDDSRGSIARACKRYCEQWPEMKRNHMGVLFYGSKGTGKTFYASCIVNEMIEQHVVSVMTTTANLMNVLSKWDKEATMDAIRRVPLLALDDLGAERDTSYSAELMYNVIDTRCKCGLPTIVTTNLDFGDMKAEEDIWRGRIYDRVIEMCPIAIPMTGESRRSGIADQRKALARELLRGDT